MRDRPQSAAGSPRQLQLAVDDQPGHSLLLMPAQDPQLAAEVLAIIPQFLDKPARGADNPFES